MAQDWPRYYTPPRNGRDASKLTIPLVAAIVAAAMVVPGIIGGTYWVAVQFGEIKFAIERVRTDLGILNQERAKNAERVREEIERRTADRWTQGEQQLWCIRAERANSKLGWQCPSMEARPLPDWGGKLR